MWSLIIMTCVFLECEHVEVLSEHKTVIECEKAMSEVELKDGQAALCWKQEDVRT